jgi:hypothetical protein
MRVAHIGSAHTYTRFIYELDLWDYLKDEPSFSPQKGTKVHMYRFDKADKSAGNARGKAAAKGVDKAIENDTGASKGRDRGDAQAIGKGAGKADAQLLNNI